MQISSEITLTAFGPEHIDGAVALSRQAQWPHRPEDWRMALSLSAGTVAVDAAGHVVGTILLTRYQQDCATISMVIVDEALRGHGLGRRLMGEAMAHAGTRLLRLTATIEGLPLYQKLGFVECGEIRQHQGTVQTVASPGNVQDAGEDDLAGIKMLDRAAFGADRGALIDLLAASGRLAVVRRNGRVEGFAAIRPFGRGEVIGPVVAADPTNAKALIAFFAAPRTGAFLRIDTPSESGLSDWLADIGLAPVGGGIVMHVPSGIGTANPGTAIFALASQALG
ncbi:MAG TPA: GNAT family N-acetyltransferase [Aliidongia sp.]|uniref:GNAT family N-acetyltransferase n=1 Tax=Aliidongia sp. TaxID=1914230 RepID=UPI002DDC9A28|nr:GNAT family N-acetyltransferase [Aliidongia sp.]HEV2677155.1 GNAT family N-acetyltransferase [Aliidongia sp.]